MILPSGPEREVGPWPRPLPFRSILLFGMPGSGKGTQGAVLGQLPGMIHISSGDLFRKLPKHGELGREVVSYTSRGLLVPDDLTIRIWKRHIEILRLQEELIPGRTTLILDGLPRNYAQAAQLGEVLDVVQIFHLCINDIAQARDRLAARALRENRLDDINEEVIQRRFQVYHEETEETLRFYRPVDHLRDRRGADPLEGPHRHLHPSLRGRGLRPVPLPAAAGGVRGRGGRGEAIRLDRHGGRG